MRHLLPLSLMLLSLPALAVPGQFSHQGRMMDATGLPLDGSFDVEFRLYDDPSGTDLQWSELHTALPFDDGYYTAALGASTPLDPALFDSDDAYLTLSIDSGPELPTRIRLLTVPFAMRADHAATAAVASSVAGGGGVDASEVMVNGTTVIDSSGNIDWSHITGAPTALGSVSCGTGQIVVFDGLDWQCGDADDHEHDASDLTSGTLDIARLPVGAGSNEVAAGDHLHGLSSLTGQATFAQLPVGTGASEVAAGNHGHDIAALSGQAAFGQLPVGTGASQVAAGNHSHDYADLSGTPTTLSDLAGCGAGEVAKYDGSSWSCAPDVDTDTDTQLSEAAVEGFITNGAIDLAPGSSIGGSSLSSPQFYWRNWGSLSNSGSGAVYQTPTEIAFTLTERSVVMLDHNSLVTKNTSGGATYTYVAYNGTCGGCGSNGNYSGCGGHRNRVDTGGWDTSSNIAMYTLDPGNHRLGICLYADGGGTSTINNGALRLMVFPE